MRCGCILVLLAIGLVIAGAQGMREAHAFSKPVDVACEEFLKSPRHEGWYRITGCTMDLSEAAYSEYSFKSSLPKTKDDDKSISEVYLPIHSATSEKKTVAKNDETPPPTNLVVKTTDEAILNTVREMSQLDENKNPKEVEKWMLANLQKVFLRRDVMGMVLTGINDADGTRDELAKLHDSLAPGYVILEEGKKPSTSGSLGLIFGGLALGFVSVLYWFSRASGGKRGMA